MLQDFLDEFHRMAIGFNDFMCELDANQEYNSKDNYPPYNIIHNKNKDEYIIELALAGFEINEIEIHLDVVSHGGQKLLIASKKDNSKDQSSYIVKGVAARNFQKAFTLAPTIRVQRAKMENGLLRIFLQNLKNSPSSKQIVIDSEDTPEQQLLNETA